jgi:hypothetical protein
LLKAGPLPVEEIAEVTGSQPSPLYRLLRALASFGVFAEDGQRRFTLTPMACLLQTDVPGSLRPFALWSGNVSYQTFGGLESSVRTGKPAFEQIFGMEFFDYLASNPETGVLFSDLMAWNTGPVASVLASRDFTAAQTVIDVGGGRGELLTSILKAHPAIRGVLVDRPSAIAMAKPALERNGLSGRCTLVCRDILKSVPRGGDVYILKSVIHGLDDANAIRVLQNCREAMNPGTRILLIEFIMPPGNDRFPGKLMDLLMLVGCYGRERSGDEFRSLSSAAALQIADIEQTKYGYSIIECAAVPA